MTKRHAIRLYNACYVPLRPGLRVIDPLRLAAVDPDVRRDIAAILMRHGGDLLPPLADVVGAAALAAHGYFHRVVCPDTGYVLTCRKPWTDPPTPAAPVFDVLCGDHALRRAADGERVIATGEDRLDVLLLPWLCTLADAAFDRLFELLCRSVDRDVPPPADPWRLLTHGRHESPGDARESVRDFVRRHGGPDEAVKTMTGYACEVRTGKRRTCRVVFAGCLFAAQVSACGLGAAWRKAIAKRLPASGVALAGKKTAARRHKDGR